MIVTAPPRGEVSAPPGEVSEILPYWVVDTYIIDADFLAFISERRPYLVFLFAHSNIRILVKAIFFGLEEVKFSSKASWTRPPGLPRNRFFIGAIYSKENGLA